VCPEVVLVTAAYRQRPLAVRMLRPGGKATFHIGSATDVDAPAATPEPRHELVSWDAMSALTVHVPAGMAGVVVRAGMRVPLAAFGPGPLRPPADAHVELTWGELSFTIERSAAPDRVPKPPAVTRKGALPYLVSSAFVLSLVGLASFVPPGSNALADGDLPRWVRTLPAVYVPPVPPPLRVGLALPSGAGLPGHDRAPQRRTTRPHAARGRGESSGAPGRLLGLFEALRAPAFRDLVASTSPLLEQGDTVMAGLQSVGERDATVGGLGFAPGSTPGARAGGGLAGVSGLTTIGSCVGNSAQDRGRYGRGAAKLGTRKVQSVPEVSPGPSEVRGTLDREIVRRVVRRHVNEIKHCYDLALTRRPSLAGRLSVRFVIETGGRVLDAVIQDSSMADPTLESCVAMAVRRWSFPARPNGGLVIVTYPFTLVTRGEQ